MKCSSGESSGAESHDSRISSYSLECLVQTLLAKQTRDSTTKTYCKTTYSKNMGTENHFVHCTFD